MAWGMSMKVNVIILQENRANDLLDTYHLLYSNFDLKSLALPNLIVHSTR